MSRWTPCKRSEFIRRLSRFGFSGPYSGARHQFMVHAQHRLAIPSKYSVAQVRMLLREVETILGRDVSLDEWLGL